MGQVHDIQQIDSLFCKLLEESWIAIETTD